LGNVIKHEYYLTIDMGKEISMIENNKAGRKIRQYFIEVEKRYRQIIETQKNIFDFMRLALNQIEENETRINNVEKNIEEIKNKIDVNIKNEYCLASDIAEQLALYWENKLPHSNLIGAIARLLGYKISYKHYYEDENIAIAPDLSKGNEYYQIYYKPKAAQEIINWFIKNKSNLEYKIIYERNSKYGIKGEIKERGYKIEDVCYKVQI